EDARYSSPGEPTALAQRRPQSRFAIPKGTHNMRTFNRHSPLRRVFENEHAAGLIRERAPEFSPSTVEQFADFPIGSILGLVLGASDPRTDEIVAAISEVEDTTAVPDQAPPIHPNGTFESVDVPRGSALVRIPNNA